MEGSYKILLHFAELFAEKFGISTSVVIYAIAGVFLPLVLVLYALLSYHVLYVNHKSKEWMRFIWVLITILVIVSTTAFIIYSCL